MPFVLLFEDDRLQVKLLTDLIKYQIGLDVKSTDSLDEALALAKEGPALIISDVCLINPADYLEKMDKTGGEFSKIVKSTKETKHIPLILRSSMPLAHFGLTKESTKANIFLSKSTSNSKFLSAVKSLLSDDATPVQPRHYG